MFYFLTLQLVQPAANSTYGLSRQKIIYFSLQSVLFIASLHTNPTQRRGENKSYGILLLL